MDVKDGKKPKAAFGEMKHVFGKRTAINKNKIKIPRGTSMQPILTYVCVTWSLNKQVQKSYQSYRNGVS